MTVNRVMDYQDPPSFRDSAQDTGSRTPSDRANGRYRASHQRSSGNQDQQDGFPGRPQARYQDQGRYPDQARYQDQGRYPDQGRYQDQARYPDQAHYQDQDRSGSDIWSRSAPSPDRYQDFNVTQPVIGHSGNGHSGNGHSGNGHSGSGNSGYQADRDAPQDPAWAKIAPGRPFVEPGGPPRTGRGLLAGAVTGVLAAAVALGVAMLVSAFIRPQASPIIAVGGQAINLTPTPLKEFAVAHFGTNDKTMLLGGMYVVIALIAMVIGWLGRRKLLLGAVGIGAFGVFGAVIALIQPASRTTDVIPALVGGVAGVVAIIALVRAAEPVAFSSPTGRTRGLA